MSCQETPETYIYNTNEDFFFDEWLEFSDFKDVLRYFDLPLTSFHGAAVRA